MSPDFFNTYQGICIWRYTYEVMDGIKDGRTNFNNHYADNTTVDNLQRPLDRVMKTSYCYQAIKSKRSLLTILANIITDIDASC